MQMTLASFFPLACISIAFNCENLCVRNWCVLAFCIPISFSESRGVSFSTARGLSKSIHGYGQSPRTDRGPAVSNQVNVDTAVKSVLNLHRENVPRLFSKSFGNCGFKEYYFHMCECDISPLLLCTSWWWTLWWCTYINVWGVSGGW